MTFHKREEAKDLSARSSEIDGKLRASARTKKTLVALSKTADGLYKKFALCSGFRRTARVDLAHRAIHMYPLENHRK